MDEKQLSALHGKRWSSRDTAWAMSEENVEIVREALERFIKTGQPIWERIDADTEVFDHDRRQEPL